MLIPQAIVQQGIDGIAPASGNPSRHPLGAVMASGDRIPTTGAMHYIEVMIPLNCTITGIEIQMGTVGGTNLWIPFILDSSGAVVANGNLAGVTAGIANTIIQYAFTGTYAAKGPAQYFIGFQADGGTARFKSISTDLARNAGGSTAGTFGTLTTITPPTTFGVNLMPLCWTY